MKFFNIKNYFPVIFLLGLIFFSCADDDNPGPDLPLARFTYTKDAQTVNFINISENSMNYVWDFGDGTSSELLNPQKTYDNGTYTVVLTASDTDGNSSTYQDDITIDVPVCVEEESENTDPANGPLNWTFLTNNGNTQFDAFGGTGGSIVPNPVLDDVNSSCNVQQFVKTSGCQTFAGLGVALDNPIDFSDPETNKIFKIKVLAENQLTDVTLRLEFMPFPDTEPSQERVASITQIGEWQELTFDFSDVDTSTYQSIIIYFERDATCDGDIYYFDDITQVSAN